MNFSGQIKELALLVNDGLTSYVGVHDAIFREAAGFMSLLKNLLRRGVPMSKLLEDAERLVPQWEEICRKLDSFRRANYASLSKDEGFYFDILFRYTAAVRRTVVALVDRQRLMAEGSKGGPNNSMTFEACKQKEEVCLAAVREYTAIGQELNNAASIIFR